jgi:hypothetical protein
VDARVSGAVFVVTLEGVEAAGAPALTVLAFMRAADEAEAERGATAELEALGWTGVQVLRSGEVTDAAALPEDFRAAMQTALKFGCGLVIYEEP